MVTVEQPKVHGLSGPFGQAPQHRSCEVHAQGSLGGLAKQKCLRTQAVPLAAHLLGEVTLEDERPCDAVGRREGEPEPFGDLDDPEVAGRSRAVSLVERFGLEASLADAAGCVRAAVAEELAAQR